MDKLIKDINEGKFPKVVIIMRGLPGSGKTTAANKIHAATKKKGIILSTDDYFITEVSEFDPKKLGIAHEWNQNRAKENLQRGSVSPIIIDNTNVLMMEALPYVELALEYKFDVKVLEPETSWAFNVDKLVKVNVHQVPRRVIEARLKKYEKFTEQDIITSAKKKMAATEQSNFSFKEMEKAVKNIQL